MKTLIRLFFLTLFFFISIHSNSNNTVVITFLDGTTVEIENLKFMYEWIYSDEGDLMNPSIYHTESFDFHYNTIINHIKIEKTILMDSLSHIEFIWPSNINEGQLVCPDLAVFTFKSGKTQEVNMKRRAYEVASTFLQGKAIENIKRTSFLRNLYLIGFGTIDGQKGKFTAKIGLYGSGVGQNKSECVQKIVYSH